MYVVKRPDSLRSQAMAQLRQAIVTGRLAPSSMHSEQSIASSMSISRTPVREALLQLASEGLVEFVPQRGVRIAELEAKQLNDVYDFRSAIEIFCAEKLAELPGKHVLAALDVGLSRQQDLIDSGDHLRWVDANMEFHTILVHGVENGMINKSWGGVVTHCKRVAYRMVARKERMREALREDRAIFDAIRRHDQDRARTLAGEHLYVSRLLMNQMLDGMTKGGGNKQSR